MPKTAKSGKYLTEHEINVYEQYRKIADKALRIADEVFQGENALLPDYARLGSDKIDAFLSLAKDYKELSRSQEINKEISMRMALKDQSLIDALTARLEFAESKTRPAGWHWCKTRAGVYDLCYEDKVGYVTPRINGYLVTFDGFYLTNKKPSENDLVEVGGIKTLAGRVDMDIADKIRSRVDKKMTTNERNNKNKQ